MLSVFSWTHTILKYFVSSFVSFTLSVSCRWLNSDALALSMCHIFQSEMSILAKLETEDKYPAMSARYPGSEKSRSDLIEIQWAGKGRLRTSRYNMNLFGPSQIDMLISFLFHIRHSKPTRTLSVLSWVHRHIKANISPQSLSDSSELRHI